MAYNNKKPKGLGFEAFTKNIKKGIEKGIIILWGEEDYLINWAVSRIISRYINPATKEMDLMEFSDENYSIDSLMEAAETMAFLSEKRVIIIKGVFPENFEEIENLYINDSNTLVVFVYHKEKLEKAEKIKHKCDGYYFGKLEFKELASFITKRMSKWQWKIEHAQLRYLIDATGYNHRDSDYSLFDLVNDIDKLRAYCKDGIVTNEDIDEIIVGDKETFIFEFLDALSADKKATALEMFKNMDAKDMNVFQLLASIISQFEIALSLRQLLNDGVNYKDGARFLRINEYRAKRILGLANRLTMERLKEGLLKAYNVEKDIKSGLLSESLAVELFIMGI